VSSHHRGSNRIETLQPETPAERGSLRAPHEAARGGRWEICLRIRTEERVDALLDSRIAEVRRGKLFYFLFRVARS
jgi:hypothetical protein